MIKYLEFKNISTIITSILLTIFGLLLGYLSSMGFNLPVTADVLASICGGVILAVFSYYNAKHHNDLFDEENDTLYIPVDELSESQVKIINNFIKNSIDGNIGCNCEKNNEE